MDITVITNENTSLVIIMIDRVTLGMQDYISAGISIASWQHVSAVLASDYNFNFCNNCLTMTMDPNRNISEWADLMSWRPVRSTYSWEFSSEENAGL